ncbi:NlpC/P60 family protein [Arthrobacter sp. YD4]|jgi:cell wall-associated NlpC family hydrolase|uniref:NlpC/P60 family protein n=1 Tax=unclassified Arthrobacter TaxID=235627 RepID=UPI0025B38011|nr:NlpC/P60 family protein [Arthrobacter sp. YD4]MDN3936675.1 NlpC/P60 family protein [Arthrobacter sp. YD4]
MTSRSTDARPGTTATTGRGAAFAAATGTVGRQAAVVLAASGLVLTSGMAANAAGNVPAERESAPVSHADVAGKVTAPVTADSAVQISFDRPAVATTPAPVVEAPAPAPAAAPAVAKAPVAQAPAAPVAKVTVQAAAPAPAPAAAPAGGVNAAMLSAAYSQIGITQDCTAMVEKALGAAGIPVGDLGPQQFLNYGKVVSDPQPGDMIVQSGHVAIYAGNGQAISGGMNGSNQTIVHPLSWLTATGGVTFVRAGA